MKSGGRRDDDRNHCAARTSVYYAVSPFIGGALSLILFREMPSSLYFFALLLMIVGAWLSASEKPIFGKKKKTGPE